MSLTPTASKSARTRCFTVQLGPGWLASAAQERLRLGAPREEPGGRLAWMARQLYEEFTLGEDASPLVIEGLTLAMLGEVATIRLSRGGSAGHAIWSRRASASRRGSRSLPRSWA
jgi:hypothetical protein